MNTVELHLRRNLYDPVVRFDATFNTHTYSFQSVLHTEWLYVSQLNQKKNDEKETQRKSIWCSNSTNYVRMWNPFYPVWMHELLCVFPKLPMHTTSHSTNCFVVVVVVHGWKATFFRIYSLSAFSVVSCMAKYVTILCSSSFKRHLHDACIQKEQHTKNTHTHTDYKRKAERVRMNEAFELDKLSETRRFFFIRRVSWE